MEHKNNFASTINSLVEEAEEFDAVERPVHYANGKIECIDAMLSARGVEDTVAFCECNAFKYIWRTGKKDDAVQELRKASWYINKAIELRTNKQK